MATEATPASPTAHEQFLSFLNSQEEQTGGEETQQQEGEIAEGDQVEGAEAESGAEDQQQQDVEQGEEEATASAAEPKIRLRDGRELTAEEVEKGILMQADYTRKRQAAAEKERAVDAEQQRILAEKSRVAQTLQQLEQAMQAAMPPEPNWEQVQKERPESFVEEYAQYQVQKDRMSKLAALKEKAEREAMEEQMISFQRHIEREAEVLAEKIPEWKDPAKKKAEGAEIKAYALGLGFTEEQLKAGITDHRMVLLLRDAARFNALKNKTKGPIPGKKVAPVVLRPGSTTPPRPPVSETTRIKQRLAKTGRQSDAAEFFLKSGILD